MMVYEDFVKLEGDDSVTILAAINQHLDEKKYDSDNTTLISVDLPFYHGYQFIEVSDNSVYPVRKTHALYNDIDGETHILSFTHDFIYQMNARVPIMLDSENVYDYVRFFFSYVSGAHGRFIVVDSIDDITWRETPPPNAKDVISKMIAPLALLEETKDGDYILQANMTFKTGLFKAKIAVTHDGYVEVGNEEMLVEDMPITDDVVGF